MVFLFFSNWKVTKTKFYLNGTNVQFTRSPSQLPSLLTFLIQMDLHVEPQTVQDALQHALKPGQRGRHVFHSEGRLLGQEGARLGAGGLVGKRAAGRGGAHRVKVVLPKLRVGGQRRKRCRKNEYADAGIDLILNILF